MMTPSRSESDESRLERFQEPLDRWYMTLVIALAALQRALVLGR